MAWVGIVCALAWSRGEPVWSWDWPSILALLLAGLLADGICCYQAGGAERLAYRLGLGCRHALKRCLHGVRRDAAPRHKSDEAIHRLLRESVSHTVGGIPITN